MDRTRRAIFVRVSKPLRVTKAAHQRLDPEQLAQLGRQNGWPPLLIQQAKDGDFSWRTVLTLAYSQNGKLLASAGNDGMIRLWDAGSGQRVAEWRDEDPGPPPLGPVNPLQVQRDRLRQLFRFPGGLSGATDLPLHPAIFAASDTLLITAGRDSLVRLWDLKTHKVVDTLRAHATRVNAITISQDAKYLASGSEDGNIILWDFRTRLPEHSVTLAALGRPDLSHNALLNENERITLEEQARIRYPGVDSLAFSPDNQWLAAALRDGTISLLETAAGQVEYRGSIHEEDAAAKKAVTVYFTKEGELLSVGGDQTVRHWDLPAWSSGRRVLPPLQSFRPVARWAGTAGPTMLAAGNIVRLVPSSNALQFEWRPLLPGDNACALASGREDGRSAVATNDGRVFILDLRTGKPTVEFKGPDGKRKPLAAAELPRRWGTGDPYHVPAVAVQARGQLAASAWEDGSIDLWRIGDGGWFRSLRANLGPVRALSFGPDGRQLAATYSEGQLVLWNVESGTPDWQTIIGPKNAHALRFSPDGRLLVQAGDLGIIALWDVATGKRSKTLGGHVPISLADLSIAVVKSAAYSPDGRWLATSGAAGDIRLWDAAAGYQLSAVLSVVPIRPSVSPDLLDGTPAARLFPHFRDAAATGHEYWALDLTFTADSRQLVAATVQGEVRVYEMSAIVDPAAMDKANLVSQTEQIVGLRLEGDGPAESKLVPIPQEHLARVGESLRKDYTQDILPLFRRISEANQLNLSGRPAQARDQG